MARTPPDPLQGWNRINQCKGLLRVVTIGFGELDGQRDSPCVANQMTLAAKLGPIGWIGTGLLPPKTARTELPSTTARDQSIVSRRASQSKITKWSSCQIPASCQSRKRRQQLMPEPQPSPCGSIRQGIPLRSTKMMPARHARSVRRGRPPCGLGNGIGRRGSIKFHDASGTRAPAM